MIMSPKRKKIPAGTKLPVCMSVDDHQFILDHTFVEPKAFGLGVTEGHRVTYQLSLDDIEYIQGFIAAEANHTKSKKIENRLDPLFEYFQEFLDEFDDQ